MRSIKLVIIAQWVGKVLALFLVVIGLVFALAQTAVGKHCLATLIAELLSTKMDKECRVGGITGIFPFSIHLKHFAAADSEKKDWLIIEEITLIWSPLHLLRGHVRIDELSAATVRLTSLPQQKQTEKSGQRELPSLPNIFPRITVERFLVGRLILEQALLGKSAEMSVTGRLSRGKSFSRVEGFLGVERIDRQKGHASVSFVYDSMEVPTFSMSGRMEEDADGMLFSLLDLETKPPFAMKIALQGPLRECKGKATVTAGDYGYLDTGITLRKGPTGVSAAAAGILNIEPTHLGERFLPLLSGESSFSLSLGYRPGEMLSLNAFSLTTDDGSLVISGSVALPEQRLQGDFEFSLADLSLLRGLIPSAGSGRLAVRGSLSEFWHKPAASFTVLLEDAEIADLRLARFDGHFESAFLESPLGFFSGLRLQGKGIADALSYPGFDAFWRKKLSWAINGDFPTGGTVAFNDCSVTDGNISLLFTGTFDPATADISAGADVAIVNGRHLFPESALDFAGANAFKASIEGNIRTLALTSQIEGEVKNLHVNNAYIAALLGSKVHYSGHAAVSEGNRLTFTDVRIGAAAVSAAGDCSYSIPERSINGNWQVLFPQLSVLSQPLGYSVSGSAQIDGALSGYLAALATKATFTGETLILENHRFEKVNLSFLAEGVPEALRGTVQFEAVYANEKLEVRSDVRYEDSNLRLTGISFALSDTSISGNLEYDLQNTLIEGVIEGRSEDLSSVASLAGEQVQGSARLKARLTKGTLGQNLFLDLSGEDLVTRFGQVRELVIRSDLSNIFNTIEGSGELSVSTFQKGDLRLETAAVTGAGDKQTVNFTVTAQGRYLKEVALNVQGVVTSLPQFWRLDVMKLDGNYGEIPFVSSQPTSIIKEQQGFLLENLIVQIGSGRLMAAGTFRDQELDSTAAVEKLPLQILESLKTPELSGTLSGLLRVAGPLESPKADLTLKCTNAHIGGRTFKNVPPATISIAAKVADGWFQGSALLQSLDEKPIEANLSLPVTFSFTPLVLTVSENGAIQGKVTGDINLSYLPAVLYLEDQVLTGLASVDLGLAGNTRSPDIKGHAIVKDASYENAKSGTILKNIELDIQADNERIVLQKCHANDGGKGTMSARGWLNLDREKQFACQTDLDFEKATLLRQDTATANVSGKLKFSGGSGKMALNGGLTVNGAEILIPERLPPEVTELEVIEINQPGNREQSALSPKSHYAQRLSLDLTVGSPGRVYLRGCGLDAELKGALFLAGNLSAPAITGDLSLVRGSFILFDKRFALVSGTLSYGGSTPPEPTVEVTAERTQGDFTARVRLSGKLSAPQVTLESDPLLPTDEIVSRILFGRSATSITPVQGLQLAQALESLSGKNFGMLDILSHTRKILGVDRLSVDQSGEEEGVNVNVGKYLKNGIYVEFEKGAGTKRDQVFVEIEITPNITIESEAGTDAEGGIGLNWKLDY